MLNKIYSAIQQKKEGDEDHSNTRINRVNQDSSSVSERDKSIETKKVSVNLCINDELGSEREETNVEFESEKSEQKTSLFLREMKHSQTENSSINLET